MVEKKLFEQLIRRIKKGTLTVQYWDGTEKTFGKGEPSARMTITSPKVIRAMFKNISLGAGEAYMDETLLLEPLDAFMNILYMNLPELIGPIQKLNPQHILSQNVRGKQANYIQQHYDLGNDFYKLWLDNDTMAYTCAYFKNTNDTLEQAQVQKIEHVLRKLQLRPGMEIAELGCGWGRLLVAAAKEYGVSGVGVTLSKEQHAYAQQLAKREKVDSLVTFKLANYQELAERGKQYDRVYSVGLFEHVGRGNQDQYFKAVDTLLKPGGVSFLHSITSQIERATDAWTDRYIFPGGHIHAVSQMVGYLPAYDFRLMDYESLRLHYALTLDEWWRRFDLHKDEVIEMFDERFYRMWSFWLAASSANFRYGEMDLSQMVFSKGINNDLPLTREHIYKQK
jgi:cyclopropane-fatty-acyl-phospholipid synthase